MKIRKLSPLVILTILGIVVGGVVASWYWSSNSISMSVSITGYLNAKANVNPLSIWVAAVKQPYESLIEEAVFFSGSEVLLPEGPNYIFVRIGDSNAHQFFTRVTATYPAGMIVTCEVSIVDRRGNIPEYPEAIEFWHDLGPIAVDGTEAIQLIARSDPLYMFSEPDTHARFIMYRFSVGEGSLPPGTHQLSVEVHLGDTIDGF